MVSVVDAGPDQPEHEASGVSRALAAARAAAITDLRYDVHLTIPPESAVPMPGRVRLQLRLRSPQRLVLDFAGAPGSLHGLTVNGVAVDPRLEDEHLTIDAAATRAGANTLVIDFVAGESVLHRRKDLAYTLFVPARARAAFPCFDQPDLRGRLSLTLDVPEDWEAVSNGRLLSSESAGGGRRLRFAETPPLPTYLMAFAAGRLRVASGLRGRRELRVVHHGDDAAATDACLDVILDLHAHALDWLEAYTGMPYPFDHFDMVLIPSFQFGGMEHPGAVYYDAGRLLLEAVAPTGRRLERARLIAHETTHMWFGDLVTMRWFDDVWLKEAFATHLADRIVASMADAAEADAGAVLAHHPAAYAVDRTGGANPIRQPLDNLSRAGELYGPILYHKAPVLMRQLEWRLGAERFRDGVRDYLRRHAFGHASWPDLLHDLEWRDPGDLRAWSHVWVDGRGRPTISAEVPLTGDGTIRALTLKTTDPFGLGRTWPQRLAVALGYPEGPRRFDVDVSGARTPVPAAAGLPAPRFVLPGTDGVGYGLVLLDEASAEALLDGVGSLSNASTRAAAWVALWDNVLEGQITASRYLAAAARALPCESDPLVSDWLAGLFPRIFWSFLAPPARVAWASGLEVLLRNLVETAPDASRAAASLAAYRALVTTDEGIEWLRRVWRSERPFAHGRLAAGDTHAMALDLVVRDVRDAETILDLQASRSSGAWRARLSFVRPAVSADAQVRAATFRALIEAPQRAPEPWTVEALRYLSHPLRAADALAFIDPGLEALERIQRTGDIFFPVRWVESLLWGHRSPEAAERVRQFLAARPDYPERLRWIVLSAADTLFRTAEPH